MDMTPPIVTKPCRKCGAVKLLSDFPVNKSCADGHTAKCRVCTNAYKSAWKKRNRQKLNAAARRAYWAKRKAENGGIHVDSI
jgi:hypothetical protein